jgi:GntR family transcriptional regulator
MLAIASGELPAGSRLPSTRSIARRHRLHPNTVSAAYQQLESLRWVDSVRGSGVYVRADLSEARDAQLGSLDRIVLSLLQAARSLGLSASAVRGRVDHWLSVRPKRFVFVHPDEALRAIICEELRQALTWPVADCEANAAGVSQFLGDSVLVTVPSKLADVRALASTSEVVALQVRQVARLLAQHLPVPPEVLTVVASGWPRFLAIARTMLMAAGCDPDSLVFRDAKAGGWTRGLGARSAVVCDVLTAASAPEGMHKIVFALVSDASIAGLRSFERFFGE